MATVGPMSGDVTMDVENLEREALKELSVTELDRLWFEQASSRGVQIDAGEVELVSDEDVDRKARALLR